MGELREMLLRQQLQAELEKARKLEASGMEKEAGAHYLRAGAISRTLAFSGSRVVADGRFQEANQYEAAGNVMRAAGPEAADANASAIDQLIITLRPDTKWEEIGGLDEAKKTLRQAIIIPFIRKRPRYVNVTRSILLYGPPGTGKTLLAKASSNTLSAAFFEARAPGLLSKYFGESGKLISALFSKAKKMQPSLIFMDEIDSLAPRRDSGIDESSRRVLGQLLSELEGFSSRKEDRVVFIGATNKPWDLDEALLSRFQRKVYVPLPDARSREKILSIHLEGAGTGGLDMKGLAGKTEGFSGRDLASLCQEAVMLMVREQNPGLEQMNAKQLETYDMRTRDLKPSDFEEAFAKIRPACKEQDLRRYSEWKDSFG